MEDFTKKRERLYLAYLEEKCHIHPTAEVEFEEDEDVEYSSITIYPRIGGFDCGIRFTDGDILTWLIEQDIKPSEVKDYTASFDSEKEFEEVVQPSVDAINKKIVDSLKEGLGTDVVLTNPNEEEAIGRLKEVRPGEEFNIRSFGDSEIEFLIEEKSRNGGGSFVYNGDIYEVDNFGRVTVKNSEGPKNYNASEWFDAVKKGNPPRFG